MWRNSYVFVAIDAYSDCNIMFTTSSLSNGFMLISVSPLQTSFIGMRSSRAMLTAKTTTIGVKPHQHSSPQPLQRSQAPPTDTHHSFLLTKNTRGAQPKSAHGGRVLALRFAQSKHSGYRPSRSLHRSTPRSTSPRPPAANNPGVDRGKPGETITHHGPTPRYTSLASSRPPPERYAIFPTTSSGTSPGSHDDRDVLAVRSGGPLRPNPANNLRLIAM